MRRHLSALLAALIAIPSASQTVPIDYSYCGYHRSEKPIPSARVVVYVEPQSGDNSELIQAAIDYVGRQKADTKSGLRGAVLLGPGTFEINQPLRLNGSGVVLRGSGRDATVLLKTGYDRGAAVYIEGDSHVLTTDTLSIDGDVTPGSTTVSVVAPEGKSLSSLLTAGRQVIIWRPSTQEWIESLDCQSFGGGKRMGYWAWHPGDIDLNWHRRVVSSPNPALRPAEGRLRGKNSQLLELDAPLTCSIEQCWGGAKLIVAEQKGLITESGVENLSIVSDYDCDQPNDEDHCWDGIFVAQAEDCWVRMVNFRHLAGSAVVVQKSARQITVEDCKSTEPVSELGGWRRRTFLACGEQILFQRCYSEHGINDFAVGHTAPGPNAFVQCESYESQGPSGSIGSWAPGLLYDCVNIDGNDLVFRNWELEKFGAGWSTCNSTMWQSTASGLFCYSPDTLNRNYSSGCWGQISGNGEYSEMNEHVKPYSLFADLLLQRLQKTSASGNVAEAVSRQCRVLERATNASSSPSIDEAMTLAQEAWAPRQTLSAWIDSARFEGDLTPGKAITTRQLLKKTSPITHHPSPNTHHPSPAQAVTENTYCVTNGWLVKDGVVLTGKKYQTPWWSGRTHDAFLRQAKPAVTRFVPGSEGTGLTDRIDSVVTWMEQSHTLLFSQNYGLWTDRRRDDHERIRRKNGDAWPPFFEQPLSRSGQLTAWDGMSRYDLTKPNKWYFSRLQQFAKKTESIGKLLKLQHYFQHNILEAGAHWVDCPWRTANNVNNTPFLEPVNFTGDKRIFTAEQFYDITNDTLRRLHRQYIRQQLDAFKGQPNVIHSIGEEFTGPLHFVQFWLDVISEWERDNGRVLVCLAVNKDVQDAILNDAGRASVVDIIDIEQWFYHAKGEYTPPGGVNMAPRQYQRKIRTGSARFEDVYRAVAEYRDRCPEKAIVYSAQKHPEMCWASLMAGGSCTAVPITDQSLLRALSTMKPAKTEGYYMLEGPGDYLIYKDSDASPEVPQAAEVYSVGMKDGSLQRADNLSGSGVFWIRLQ